MAGEATVVTDPAAAAAAATAAAAAASAAPAAAEFKPEVATAFLTEHGVDAKTLEGVKPEELKTRYESAKAIADKAAAKATEAAKPKGLDKYEFKAPEGVKLDDALTGELGAVAKKHGLSQEAANEFFALGTKMAQGQKTSLDAAVTSVKTQWAAQAQGDKEFGGDKFQENLAVSKTGLSKFATPEFVKFLNDSGLGNHPEMIRLGFRLGKLSAEDKTVTEGRGAGDTGGIANRLYGKSSVAG